MKQPLQLTVEDIKKAIAKLQKEQILEIDNEIHKYIETAMMMGAAESAFSEWMDPEEDIYTDDV
jgi:hypothetical protein